MRESEREGERGRGREREYMKLGRYRDRGGNLGGVEGNKGEYDKIHSVKFSKN